MHSNSPKDPNLDVSTLPLLEYVCAHPNLDVYSLQVQYLNMHIRSIMPVE